MIDWQDPRREDVFRFLMVDPHDLDETRGELPDVILSDTNVSYGYYTDTRTSGQISFLHGGYIENSWLRVVHEVEAEGYSNELGTYILTDYTSREQNGVLVDTYNMQSVLWALQSDFATSKYTIGTGAYSLTAFDSVCTKVEKEGLHLGGAKNHRYSSAKVYEVGESYLSILFDICDAAGDRLNVDGHGRITIGAYNAPSTITPSWTLDYDDPRSMIQAKSIKMTSSDSDVINRAIVISKSGNIEYYGSASLTSSSKYSQAARGYTYAKTYNVSDLTPETNARAALLAKQYLADNSVPHTEWQLTAKYFPCEAGETLTFTFNGESHKCLIQSIDPIDLQAMTMDLTLREV